MNEIWKDIEGYEGLYQVSNFGRIKSFKSFKSKILKPSLQSAKYLQITLCKNEKKSVLMHRLVAKAFIVNPNNLPWVNHIDGNKLNNNVDNLEWNTEKEDCENKRKRNVIPKGENHGRAKLTEKQVSTIKELKGQYTYKKLGEMFNVTKYAIYLIYKNKNWKHHGNSK